MVKQFNEWQSVDLEQKLMNQLNLMREWDFQFQNQKNNVQF